jgi:SulP family sulfate permease
VHGLFILLSILVLAPWRAYIPMASMAALLLIVAWNMSEAKHFMRIVKEAPRNDIAVLLTCFSLTVLLDIEIAVAVGLGLAAVLFIKQSIDLTHGKFVERDAHEHPKNLPHDALIYDINGPLFFGAAQRALNELVNMRREIRVVILDMTDVNLIDMTGIVALESIVKNLQKHRIMLMVNNLNPRLILRLRHAGLRRRRGVIDFSRNIDEAIAKIQNQ